MFERYTEHAKRIIFLSRYEASQFGSPQIDTEHLLLGLLREEKALSHRFILRATTADALRRKIEAASPLREKISTSVDMPLSQRQRKSWTMPPMRRIGFPAATLALSISCWAFCAKKAASPRSFSGNAG
jgi:hypothetical protein